MFEVGSADAHTADPTSGPVCGPSASNHYLRSASDVPLKRGVNYAHDQMIDLVIATPGITQNAIAEATGYSVSWVSQVMNADAFKMRLALRREQLVDPEIRESVERSFDGLIKRSQDILRDKLTQPSNQVPDQLVLRTLELSSRARGYGARIPEPPPPSTPIEVHLNILGERLVELNRKAQRTLEYDDGQESFQTDRSEPSRLPAASDREQSDQPAQATSAP